jgi:hypothetical protein
MQSSYTIAFFRVNFQMTTIRSQLTAYMFQFASRVLLLTHLSMTESYKSITKYNRNSHRKPSSLMQFWCNFPSAGHDPLLRIFFLPSRKKYANISVLFSKQEVAFRTFSTIEIISVFCRNDFVNVLIPFIGACRKQLRQRTYPVYQG